MPGTSPGGVRRGTFLPVERSVRGGIRSAPAVGDMAIVLVVEDEPTVLVLAASIIEALGHQVLTAANGGQALALVEGDAPIELVFTDINLGDGPNGLDVATAARARHPAVKVAFASGELLTDGIRALMVEGSSFLPKPYTPEQIEDTLDAAFAAEP